MNGTPRASHWRVRLAAGLAGGAALLTAVLATASSASAVTGYQPVGRFGTYVNEYTGNIGSHGDLDRTNTWAFADGRLPLRDGSKVAYKGVPTQVDEPTYGCNGGMGCIHSTRHNVFFRAADDQLAAVRGCNIPSPGDNLNGPYCNDVTQGTVANLGGVITSSPSGVALSNGADAVFARGTDGALWMWTSAGWQSLNGQFVGDPVATVRGQRVDVFVENAAHELWDSVSLDGGKTFGWNKVRIPFIAPTGNITASVLPNGHIAFAQFSFEPGYRTCFYSSSMADPARQITDASDYSTAGCTGDPSRMSTSSPTLIGDTLYYSVAGQVRSTPANHPVF